MDYNLRAKKLIHKYLNTKITHINLADSGFDNTVLLVNTDRGDFVVRFATEDFHHLKAHVFAFSVWKKKDIPVPNIIAYGTDFVIETKIQGMDLSKTKLTDAQKKLLIRDIALNLKKMHSIKTKKYGYINDSGIGEFSSWKTVMQKYISKRMDSLNKNSLVSIDMKRSINNYLKNNMKYIELSSPRLIHKDVNAGNIMIYDGKFSGIIDASDAMSGDPMFDVGIIYEIFDKKLFAIFCKYYGRINISKVKLFALINAIRNLHTKQNAKYHIDRITEILKS